MSTDHDYRAERNLTDADVEAIVNSAVEKFYNRVGKGFMTFVWAGVLVVLMGLAYFGIKK